MNDLEDALDYIGRVADVMVGVGAGAEEAYYRDPNRVADGLPTTFAQMREHAKQIQRKVRDVR